MTQRISKNAISAIVAVLVLMALFCVAAPVQAKEATAKLVGGASVGKTSDSGVSAAKRLERQSTKTSLASTTSTGVSTTAAAAVTTAAPTTVATTLPPATTSSSTTTTTRPVTTTAPATTAAPAPTTAAPTTSSMPVGDLPGWKQIFTEDFATPAPLGSFVATYGGRWGVYDDGWKDTAGQTEGTASRYYPSRVLSVQNGILNKNLHTENGVTMVAAIAPKIGDQLYGRYAVRFRADEVAGFKTAWLMWPQSGVWPRDGEIDFPEGDLDSTISAFTHHQGATSGGDQDAFTTATRYNPWHTAVTEWSPGRVNFFLDGKLIGSSTTQVPNTPMHWVLQTETCMGGCQPASTAVANVQIDWVVAYTWSG